MDGPAVYGCHTVKPNGIPNDSLNQRDTSQAVEYRPTKYRSTTISSMWSVRIESHMHMWHETRLIVR